MLDQGTEFCGKVIAAMCSLLGIEKDTDNPVSPPDQRISGKSSPNATTHDRKVGPGEETEVAGHTSDRSSSLIIQQGLW